MQPFLIVFDVEQASLEHSGKLIMPYGPTEFFYLTTAAFGLHATLLRGEGWPSPPTGLRFDNSLAKEIYQSCYRIGAVMLLVGESPRIYHQHSGGGHPSPSQFFQTLADVIAKNRTADCIKSELDSRCDFVYVLPSRAGSSNKIHTDQARIDRNFGRYAYHCPAISHHYFFCFGINQSCQK